MIPSVAVSARMLKRLSFSCRASPACLLSLTTVSSSSRTLDNRCTAWRTRISLPGGPLLSSDSSAKCCRPAAIRSIKTISFIRPSQPQQNMRRAPVVHIISRCVSPRRLFAGHCCELGGSHSYLARDSRGELQPTPEDPVITRALGRRVAEITVKVRGRFSEDDSIAERSFAWLKEPPTEQGPRVSGANLRGNDRPCRNPPYAWIRLRH